MMKIKNAGPVAVSFLRSTRSPSVSIASMPGPLKLARTAASRRIASVIGWRGSGSETVDDRAASPSPRPAADNTPAAISERLLSLIANRLEQHFLRVDEVFAVVVGELELLAKHDRAGGARLLAEAAEDAADHVDLVPHRVPLAGRLA